MTHCWTCHAVLLHPSLYLNSPDAKTISKKPGPRPVCHKCAESFANLDSKGQHLLRTFHAHEDGRGDGKKIVPAPSEFM